MIFTKTMFHALHLYMYAYTVKLHVLCLITGIVNPFTADYAEVKCLLCTSLRYIINHHRASTELRILS